MGVVITGIGLTSAVGSNLEEVKENMEKELSYIESVSYFDTSNFQSSKGASISQREWELVKKSKLNKRLMFVAHYQYIPLKRHSRILN